VQVEKQNAEDEATRVAEDPGFRCMERLKRVYRLLEWEHMRVKTLLDDTDWAPRARKKPADDASRQSASLAQFTQRRQSPFSERPISPCCPPLLGLRTAALIAVRRLSSVAEYPGLAR
jgi:hypothetical protein